MSNIAIVGFMGTGKSAVAMNLAQKLNKTYVSTDDLIVLKENSTIHDIFKNKGEPYFRSVESEVVKKASEMDNVVIDCGGGVVINEDNIKALQKKGPVICLKASPSLIYDRVKGHRHRPLLNVPDPLDAIGRLLKERESFYARADFSIDTNAVNVEGVVSKVIEILKEKQHGCA